MATLDQIDPARDITFLAFQLGESDDPILVNLAARLNNPNIMMVSQHLEGLNFTVPANQVAQVINWLSSNTWGVALEKDLQCLAQTEKGELLLSACLNNDLIASFAVDAAKSNIPILTSLSKVIEDWRSKGSNQLYMEGLKLV